ncbi:MAG: substrate-binding domain-containing protein [Clostridia bacterium]|nr:substrate-binding domain-containing protein [Clostridia bacterium]
MPIHIVAEQTGLDGYWITDILKGVKAEADKKNLAVEDLFLPNDGTIGNDIGLVLAVGYTKNWLSTVTDRINASGARAIVVNASPDCGIENAHAFVNFDYKSAMKRVVFYLKHCGKTRIAFVGCGGRLSYGIKRKATLAAASELGVFCQSYKYPGIAELVSGFLREGRGFDAVICSRDAEANRLIAALNKRKIYVPEDIYVVGIGGNRISELSVPQCTTVDTDFHKLGAAAVKLQRFLSQNPEIEGVTVSVDCPVIIHGSTENRPLPIGSDGVVQKRVAYRDDGEYLACLRAEELARHCDKIDRNIILHLSKGKNMSEIAEEMFISQSSVKYRVKKMLETADIPDRRELIKIAHTFGLL